MNGRYLLQSKTVSQNTIPSHSCTACPFCYGKRSLNNVSIIHYNFLQNFCALKNFCVEICSQYTAII